MDSYERLIKEMPAIAEAVNAFKSEQVQSQAFDALIASITGQPVADVTPTDTVPATDNTVRVKPRKTRKAATPAKDADPAAASNGTPKAKRAKAPAVTQDRSIDLSPAGVQSWPDFATAKQPRSQDERNLLAVYWMREMGGIAAVSATHVFTAYKAMGWPVPSNPRNSLQVTSSNKKWVDTSDMNDIRVTHTGDNYVVHSLPLKPSK